MALYLIGDVQGCDDALQRLLDEISFSPSRDTLYVLGDLVNRGPESAAVLRRLTSYAGSAQCLLGNHDLHLLAVAAGVRRAHRKDTLDEVLQAPDRQALLDWLAQQRLAIHLDTQGQELLMVHAGVLPQWSASQTIALAAEVEAVLRSKDRLEFLSQMFGNSPDRWTDSLTGADRLRVVVNALTRLRFCTAQGQMEFETKGGADAAPPGFMPWFEVPQRQTSPITVAFGHWSTLGWLDRTDVLSMDSGCVWGGSLSAVRLGTPSKTNSPAPHPAALQFELIAVACAAVQTPSGQKRLVGS
jgi:bis(5'-nucleosyl)-tetraphosphatase (symmetrical)